MGWEYDEAKATIGNANIRIVRAAERTVDEIIEARGPWKGVIVSCAKDVEIYVYANTFEHVKSKSIKAAEWINGAPAERFGFRDD